MKREEILEAISNKKYVIEYENSCDCVLDYDSRYSEELFTAFTFGGGNECWHGKVLYIQGWPIAEVVNDCEQAHTVLEDCLTEGDIPEEIWEVLMDCPDENELHEAREHEAIVAWIEDSKYIPYRIDGGFSNKYELYLVEPDNVAEFEEDDNAYRVSVLEWVADFLRFPDSTTQSFVTAHMG